MTLLQQMHILLEYIHSIGGRWMCQVSMTKSEVSEVAENFNLRVDTVTLAVGFEGKRIPSGGICGSKIPRVPKFLIGCDIRRDGSLVSR